jgi:glycosyltransferase involved in cell wall biosynthesis
MTTAQLEPIIIVAAHFAPESHAAMFRAFRLAKYLPAFGFRPIVVTTDTNYVYLEDPSLLPQLPPEAVVIRARYVEPTLRGLRMLAGGDARTTQSLSAAAAATDVPLAAASEPKDRLGAFSRRAYQRLLNDWVQVPDRYNTWVGPAIEACERAVIEYGARLIWTTSQPFSCNTIGLAMKQRGLRWIADFRDPLPYGRKFMSDNPRVARLQTENVRDTVYGADAITVISSIHPLILQDACDPVRLRPMHHIPTGIDEAYLPADRPTPDPANPVLVYAGEFIPDYANGFFDLFAEVANELSAEGRNLTMQVVGSKLINVPRLSGTIASLGLQERVVFVDHLPQPELYRLLVAADAALLFPGQNSHWWNSFAKLNDYIGLGLQVIADVPNPSEARKELDRAGLGHFLDGSKEERLATFRRALEGDLPATAQQVAYRSRYLSGRQVGDLARLFRSVLDGPAS